MRLLVTVLETGGDGVLGDVVVGVFAGHGASGIAGDGEDGGVREGRVCEWWAEAGCTATSSDIQCSAHGRQLGDEIEVR